MRHLGGGDRGASKVTQHSEETVPALSCSPRGNLGVPTDMCLLPDVQPPEGRSRDGLLTVSLREGGRLHLCAETQDDAM